MELRVPSRTVLAGLLAIVVIALTTLGVLDDLPQWLRGACQAAGSLAGVYLGAHLQAKDDGRGLEGAARAALANIVALAASVQALLVNIGESRARNSSAPPRTVDAALQSSEAVLGGIDGQARALLAQSRAAAEVWLQYVPDSETYLDKLAGEEKWSETSRSK